MSLVPWIVVCTVLIAIIVLQQQRILSLEERTDTAIPWARMDTLLDRAESETPADLHRRRVDEMRRERMEAAAIPTVGPGGPGNPAARRKALQAPGRAPGKDQQKHAWAHIPALAGFDEVLASEKDRAAGVIRLVHYDGQNNVEEMPLETFERLEREHASG